ncbi:Rhodanese-like domain-containing protein [Mucor mucedo]|uniref:Rhodanese-like domain-containing protein n=1 Tax=Mucor mucedo TaxID=29922 RepID=UPI00221E50C6|nr:Rhodanese-like domain-containing protein [Mucor mucedo]KAI7894016.1 Rhodanese-like domain-containing protein [Mucor mucedo]
MSSRRILQNVLVQSMRVTAMRSLRAAPVLRASILTKDVPTFTRRQFNSQANESEIFKVVDFNDIQNIIKRDGKGYDLIDVREEKEVVQGAIPTAKNVPLSQFANAWTLSDKDFEQQFGFAKPKKESQVILYCLGGVRSSRAAEYLYSLGYNNLQNYIGSWADYAEKVKEK